LKKKELHKIIYFLAYPLIYCVASLPFGILYRFSDFLQFFVFRLFGYRKKIISSNLKRAMPDKDEKEIQWIQKQFYRHFCDITLEAFKSFKMNEAQMRKRMVFKNLEILTQFEKQHRSAIIMCGHYASWEWMTSIGYHTQSPGYAIYTPLQNKYFDRLAQKIRKKHKAKLMSRYCALETIKSLHQQGKIGIYGFASDQSPQPKPKTYWRTFLGVKVPVFVGAELLAKEMDFGVVYARINRVKRGYYEASFELISDRAQESEMYQITNTFTEWLEQDIYCDPTQYLWTHKRFKHADKAPKD
jgi:KDO2-lipid IV(A) lauroyltransferase